MSFPGLKLDTDEAAMYGGEVGVCFGEKENDIMGGLLNI